MGRQLQDENRDRDGMEAGWTGPSVRVGTIDHATLIQILTLSTIKFI